MSRMEELSQHSSTSHLSWKWVPPNPVVSSESHGRHTWTSVLLQTLNTGNVGKKTINHPWLGMADTTYGETGDGVLLFYQHYPSIQECKLTSSQYCDAFWPPVLSSCSWSDPKSQGESFYQANKDAHRLESFGETCSNFDGARWINHS